MFPIGAGIGLRLHPEDRIKTPYTSWRFDAATTRMPEFRCHPHHPDAGVTAPGLGRESNRGHDRRRNGRERVGSALRPGWRPAALTLFLDEGHLVYEYNMMIIERYTARSKDRLTPRPACDRGDHHDHRSRARSPADVVLKVDGKEVARTAVKRTVPAAFTASETFDVGVDLGSPVSLDYFDRAPFAFNGKIGQVEVKLE